MYVQQFFIEGIAHSSYLLGGSTECAIIDPRRDVGIYIDAAKDMGMKITHILETHLHADFISGHIDLARETGAEIVVPKSGKCSFPHRGVSEGDVLNIQDLEIKILETPGHTPEHISYVVTDKSRGREPVCVFCGDALFVGDVGRPDMFPDRAEELASKLYSSLHEKLLKLPDFCEIYPAHGAGSLCGRAMGAKRTSTIGYEKKFNQPLHIEDADLFIKSLTTNMPPLPDHFNRCSAINGKGPVPVNQLSNLKAIPPLEFKNEIERDDSVVLDIRSYDAYGGQHVPGSYNIDFGGNFAIFAAWVIPEDKNILLIVEPERQALEASVWLRRVGLDNITGFLEGGMFAWSREGLAAGHVSQLSVHELNDMIAADKDILVVDVRSPGEFKKSHIEGALNIPAPELRTRYRELDESRPVSLICSTGHRSSLGASILKMNGFQYVYNVAGGMTGYEAAGYKF
jgi:hydroxyacylglutathione hydrolase